jgi:hypothetical protein
MEIMETVKFVALYALEGFVIAVVGATVVAGVYQLIRDKVRFAAGSPRQSQATVTAHKE